MKCNTRILGRLLIRSSRRPKNQRYWRLADKDGHPALRRDPGVFVGMPQQNARRAGSYHPSLRFDINFCRNAALEGDMLIVPTTAILRLEIAFRYENHWLSYDTVAFRRINHPRGGCGSEA